MTTQTVISVAEFKKRLEKGTIEFLFDLRSPDEFAAWRIEGRMPVTTVNIPQLDFVGEEEKFFGQLPRDREIITVCAHGDASMYSAELLQREGFRALSLAGGMDAWSISYETHQIQAGPDIYQVYRIAKGCITHVVVAGDEAVVIDAVRHLEHIEKILTATGARLVAVFDTHLQADHISGGRELAARHGAGYWLHPLDAVGAAYRSNELTDHAVFTVGGLELIAVHSPGHTPGSTSLLLDRRLLFSGDTIMKTGMGRPDLGGMATEWSHLLYQTLFTRYAVLPDSVTVLPTHATSVREMDSCGAVSLTMAEARHHDLYQEGDEAAFAARIAASLLENPERYQEIRKVNLGLLTPDEKRQQELEIGKNLCGMAGKKG